MTSPIWLIIRTDEMQIKNLIFLGYSVENVQLYDIYSVLHLIICTPTKSISGKNVCTVLVISTKTKKVAQITNATVR